MLGQPLEFARPRTQVYAIGENFPGVVGLGPLRWIFPCFMPQINAARVREQKVKHISPTGYNRFIAAGRLEDVFRITVD